MTTQIGVISDTHGLLRPEATDALHGSELIIHAGDVGASEVLEALRRIAPVVAVRGNVDTAPWATVLPVTDVVEVAGRHLYVLHQIEHLDLDPSAAGFDPVERNLWGYGRVRAIGPIDHHLPPQNVDVWVRTAPDDYGHEPFLGDVYWVAPEIRIRPTGSTTETNELHWGQTYDVTVTVRNLGDNAAVGTDVWLKYTRPYAAPNAWTPAEDTSNVALHTTVDVPALGDAEAHFVWRPDSGEVPPPYPDAHFCVLAEVSHMNDVLTHPAPTTAGGTAWDSNIRGTNNVALRNVSIQ